MKILHLISGGDSGGAKTALYSLFSSPKNGVSVSVGCLTEGEFYRDLDIDGVEKLLFLQKSRLDLSVTKKIAETVKSGGFDILHTHGARANFVAVFLKKRLSVPIITTLHSDYLLDFESPLKKLVFTPLSAFALRRIPYRAAVSDEFSRMLTCRGFDPNSTFTVYNGLDLPEKLPPKHVFDPSAPVIGCVARLDRVKGVDVLLRAAAQTVREVPDALFLFAGDGSEKKQLLKLTKELHLEKNVRFLGHLDNISEFYTQIDINVIPSRSESFPYSMLEGASFAIPTVASRVGGIPDFIKDEKTGLLFPSEDAHALASAIIRLINDRVLADSLGENAQRLLGSDFSSKNTGAAYEKIYRSVLTRERERKRDGKTCDFAVSGYYGYGNVGDEAVLHSIIRSVREVRPDATFTVLSRTPKKTSLSLGVSSRFRYGAGVKRAIRCSRVLISGGGTLMQDKTSSRSLRYYLSVIRKAKKRGLAVIQYANGFGPIGKRKNLANTVKTINENVDIFSFRDRDALDRALTAGVKVRSVLSADPTLYHEPLTASNIVKKDSIVCALCKCGGAENAVSEAAAELARKRSLRLVFAVFHPSRDLPIARSLSEKYGGEIFIPKDADDALSVFASAGAVFAMRLHALIFSALSRTPAVAVSYDEKVSGFAKEAKIPCCDAKGTSALDILALAELASVPDTTELRSRALISRDEATALLDKTKDQPK